MATRAIFKVVFELNLGIDGKPMVYLDLTHIDRATLDEIDQILTRTIKDPVGPEFMAPPTRSVA